jgi:hypothetical protein
VPENSESTPARSFRNRGSRRQSLAPREVVLGLDRVEHRISLCGAAIALVLAIVTAVEWARNLPVITTVEHTVGKACPAAYPKLHNTLCEHIVKTTKTEWEVKFLFVSIVALCILFFAIRRKRAGVACFAIFLGLGLGLGSGLVFFFLGAWLIVRAYRLQKYGIATMTGSNHVARERATARKEGRAPNLEPITGSSSTPVKSSTKPAVTKPATPEASKRYTPKKPPRRRR